MTSELWINVCPPAFERSLRCLVAFAEKLLPMVSSRTVFGSPASEERVSSKKANERRARWRMGLSRFDWGSNQRLRYRVTCSNFTLSMKNAVFFGLRELNSM